MSKPLGLLMKLSVYLLFVNQVPPKNRSTGSNESKD